MMKKMLAMVMALMMIFGIVPAMAEGEIALSADYLELTQLGQTAYLAVMENGAEKAADSYASSNEKVAVVNHGVIMAMGDGSAVITASYAGKEYTCAVKVATDFSVVIDGEGVLNLKSGETAALSAQVNLPTVFDTVTGVNWSSTDEKVASVNADGVLTAVGPGICVIKAESQTQKTVESRSMYGTFVSTDPAEDSIVVVVDNEYDAEKYPDLLGLYTGSYDWQGFVEDLKKNAPVWTAEKFLWIRAIMNLELREDGTFRQEVLNAQRKGYQVNADLPDGDTYEVQSAKYQKCYVYNRYGQVGAELSTDEKKFHDVAGMTESGINNFAEVGVFAVLDGQLVLYYNGQTQTLGAAEGNEWAKNIYVPFNNMVAMSENMAMLLTKEGAEEAADAADDQPAGEEEAKAAEAIGESYTGIASMTWHGDTEFTAIVDVTIDNGVITGVNVREGSVIDTGTESFRLWAEGKDAYFAQYIGKDVQVILDLVLTPSANVDHFDGGKIEGGIDAVTGATASSTTVAMAVQDAVKKATEE